MGVFRKVNRDVKEFMLHSSYVPLWLSRLFGRVRGRMVCWLYRSSFCPGPKHPRRYIASLLRDGDVFLDVGASYGMSTLVGTAAVGKYGAVYSFEPQTSAFEAMVHTKERFGWDSVRPVQSLVGDYTGECVLYEYPDNSRLSSTSPMWKGDAGVPVTHPITTLDDWAARNGVDRADLVKIDVEGAELMVIRGARGFLGATRPALLIEINNRDRRREHWGYTIDDLLGELRGLGYHDFFALRPKGPVRFVAEDGLIETDTDMLAEAQPREGGFSVV